MGTFSFNFFYKFFDLSPTFLSDLLVQKQYCVQPTNHFIKIIAFLSSPPPHTHTHTPHTSQRKPHRKAKRKAFLEANMAVQAPSSQASAEVVAAPSIASSITLMERTPTPIHSAQAADPALSTPVAEEAASSSSLSKTETKETRKGKKTKKKAKKGKVVQSEDGETEEVSEWGGKNRNLSSPPPCH